ncbi:APC family permease [Shinella sp.]|uniref:APC family permease n=1 Tax=Shinella sp. TaxID=1870904 RepID=UPI003F70237B
MSKQASADTPANRLRPDSLGVGAITFLVVSAAAPLTATAGGVPMSMLLGNGAGIPAAFLVVVAVLLLFSVGYVTMTRYVRNAGAFYAYASQGIGGIAGGAASLVAILAYNAMQIGVYGLFGAATAGFLATLGITLPWWACAFAGIAIVAVCGYRHVDLSAKILAVLVLLEFLVVIIVDAAILVSGGDSGFTFTPFTPAAFFSGSPAIGLLFCFASFVGFEATAIYSEEARDPLKTVPRATYVSVLTIGIFYMLTSWLMVIGAGEAKLLPELQSLADPTTFLFALAERYVGSWIVPIMSLLFISSLFAAVLALHNAVARYVYVGGREGLFPRICGTTHGLFQSPHVGSVVQTVIAIVVIAYFAIAGLDPVLALFAWLTMLATLAVMVLMALTAVAIFCYFRKNPQLEHGIFVTTIAPLSVAVTLAAMIYFVTVNFGVLTGASLVLAVALPALIPAAAIIGILLATRLRGASPDRFAQLGFGI